MKKTISSLLDFLITDFLQEERYIFISIKKE